MLHPIRSRLFIALHSGEKTALELCGLFPDIPAGSVYRHLNILLEAELIRISKEEKARGPASRRFVVNHSAPLFSTEEREAIDATDLVSLLQTFLATVESKGQAFASGAKFPLAEGEIGMIGKTMHLTDDEYQVLRKTILDVFLKQPRSGTKPRYIAYFSFPDDES